MKIKSFIDRRLCIAPIAIAVLGALLLAGCTCTKPDDSGGRVSIKSPDGTIGLTIRGNGPPTYFLGPGAWTLKLRKDAPDCETVGEHLLTEQRVVTAADELSLPLARAGGAVASFEPAARQ